MPPLHRDTPRQEAGSRFERRQSERVCFRNLSPACQAVREPLPRPAHASRIVSALVHALATRGQTAWFAGSVDLGLFEFGHFVPA
jgi:hypothetical protein